MSEYFEFMAWIGPQWRRSDETYFYDWTVRNPGVSDYLQYTTTLSATLNPSDVTANVASASAFPSAGGIWIGPNGTSQGWEYCEFTGKTATSLNGLNRIADDREHNGIHSSGAIIYFWFPLATRNDGNLSWSWKTSDTYSNSYWSATLSGALAPKNVLRPGHAVIVQSRTDPTASFTNFMLGWITDAYITDDYGYTAKWNISFSASPAMVNRDKAPVFTVGAINLGKSGSASASSTLAAAWKERQSGDYTAASPSFAASNVSDEDGGSLWISDRYIGTGYTETSSSANNDPTMLATLNELMISQIHFTQPAGQSYGYQWMELTALGAKNWPELGLFIGFEDVGTIDLAGKLPALAAGDKVIICENKDKFQEENPNHSAKTIISLDEIGMYTAFNRSPAGGGVGIYRTSSTGNVWLHYVVWGTGHTKVGVFLFGTTTFWSSDWPGTTVSALTANSGYTLRYIWANSSTARNNWTYDIINYPGYKLGASGAKEWVLIQLPGMDLSLKSAMTSGYTGLVTLSKSGGDSNNGLARSGSFTLQIGSEQVTASVSGTTQVNVTARGVNSTTAAAHVAGDPVYLVVSGVATDAYMISQIKWTRQGGTSYAKDFKVYTSSIESPRTPEELGYTTEYSSPITVTANTGSTWTSSTLTSRARSVLIETTAMTVNPSRVRFNSIQATIASSTLDSSTVVASGNAADIVEGILGAVGFPSSGIVTSYSGTNFDSNTTAADYAWKVIADVADYAHLYIYCDLMSKLYITDNYLWTVSIPDGGIITPAVSWQRSNNVQIELAATIGEPISQAQVNWRAADNSSSGQAYYPSSPVGGGEVKVFDDYICPNSSTAQIVAKNRYWRTKYPYTVKIQPSAFGSYIAGEYHSCSWAIDPNLPGASRLVFITSADHVVSNRVGKVTLSGIEIRYSAEQ